MEYNSIGDEVFNESLKLFFILVAIFLEMSKLYFFELTKNLVNFLNKSKLFFKTLKW